MRVRVAPLGGGFLVYADEDDGHPPAADVNVIDTAGIRGKTLIESAINGLGYLLLDRRSGYHLLQHVGAIHHSHAVRHARSRMPPSLRARIMRSRPAAVPPAAVMLDLHAGVGKTVEGDSGPDEPETPVAIQYATSTT